MHCLFSNVDSKSGCWEECCLLQRLDVTTISTAPVGLGIRLVHFAEDEINVPPKSVLDASQILLLKKKEKKERREKKKKKSLSKYNRTSLFYSLYSVSPESLNDYHNLTYSMME